MLHHWKSKIVKCVISLIILIIIYRSLDIKIFSTFKYFENPTNIFIAFLFPLTIIPIIGNNRWKVFLNALSIHETLFTLMRISFVSVFLGIMLPSSIGYDAIRIYQIEKRNLHKKGSGGASVFVERILGFLVLSLLALLGAYISYKNGISINILFFILTLNTILIFALFILKNEFMYTYLFSRLQRIRKGKNITFYITSTYTAINKFPFERILLTTIPLIVFFQLSTILCGFFIFCAFGVNIPFYYHLAFLPLIQIIAIIPISISGFGIREGGFIYFYGLLGVDHNISFLVSILYYLILVITPALIGMFIYLFGKENYKSDIKDFKKRDERQKS